ncbi:hypothetical protein ES703_53980 [subsurface metagenome]
MENHTELIEGSVDYITLPELLAKMDPKDLCLPNEGMTIRQAAKIKGVAPGTLRRHLHAGKIPFKLTIVNDQPEYRIFNP